MQVREATPDDVPALAELRWEFRALRGQPVTEPHDDFVTRCAAWMRERLSRGEWRAWLAEDGGRVLGNVWVHPIDKLPNPIDELERHAYLSNLYVSPDARGGVGSRLLDAAIAWASANDRSRPLYARHGFAVSDTFLAKRFRDH
jgi:GNAT superfamily N-acetyltransferase